jgi:hypothetical protein
MEVRMSSFVPQSVAWSEEPDEARNADGGASGQSRTSGAEAAGGRPTAGTEPEEESGGFCAIEVLTMGAECAAAAASRGRNRPQNVACAAAAAAVLACASDKARGG